VARVLVLDDEEDACLLIKRMLEKTGHEVSLFTRARDALDWAANAKPALAIVEIGSQQASGIPIFNKLKACNDNMKLILTAGYLTSRITKKAKDLGADACLVKPIEMDKLEKIVDEVLET